MNLREAARRLEAIATDIRDVAAQVDGIAAVPWAVARDLRATAFTLDRHAAVAERAGIAAGEPDPAGVHIGAMPDPGWPVDHEYHDG